MCATWHHGQEDFHSHSLGCLVIFSFLLNLHLNSLYHIEDFQSLDLLSISSFLHLLYHLMQVSVDQEILMMIKLPFLYSNSLKKQIQVKNYRPEEISLPYFFVFMYLHSPIHWVHVRAFLSLASRRILISFQV